MVQQTQQQSQSGAVALFVVIFATMLMIIVTLSFIRLMISDQRQATATDLSQSAYDSAQTGVEDAKRLLLLHQACSSGVTAVSGGYNCSDIEAAVESGACNTVAQIFANPNEETMIQQNTSDENLQQAYTCVSVDMETDDYEGQVALNQSNIVPLMGVSSFDSVEVSWFSERDVSTGGGTTVGFPSPNTTTPLPPVGSRWPDDNPSMLRAQFMQTGSSFSLSDFDDSQLGNRSNTNTLFLYPAQTGSNTMSYALDARRDPASAPERVRCDTNFTVAEYVCRVRLQLPAPITGATADGGAFLRLGALYNDTHYRVQLFNGGIVVPFDGVQPEIDSTGRANDLFRRVISRVELRNEFVYPEAAIDLQGNLCKNFAVTDQPSGYTNSSTCTP